MKMPFLAMLLLALFTASVHATEGPDYKGFRVCAKCHSEQAESWRKSPHANAFESLRPAVKAEAKRKAKLDPAKDYTQDKDCVACHVTGYGSASGFRIGMDPSEAKALVGVGCESCHGAGGAYREKHADAGDKLKATGEATDRQLLVAARQNFDYETACARCHLNHPGSKWAQAKPPYSPFTPAVDPKYQFDFDTAVRAKGEKSAIHTHYRLRGAFKGGPVPAMRAEIQKTAQETEE